MAYDTNESPDGARVDQARQKVRDFHARCKTARPSLRDPTEDEIEFFAQAIAHGGYLVPREWCEYLTTASVLPVNWSTWVHCEDYGDPTYEGPAAAAREGKRTFYVRVQNGDLRALTERVQATLIARAA